MIKRMFFVAACCLMCSLAAVAQESKDLTPEQKSFIYNIFQYLRQEGYVPTIDGNAVRFKKEDVRHWITVEDQEPFYLELHKAGYTLTSLNMDAARRACMQAMYDKRQGKAYIDETGIDFSAEQYCASASEFRAIFSSMMTIINAIKKDMSDLYDEYTKEK